MARGLTLDTGALIALERRRVGITRLIRAAVLAQDRVTVPSPVIVEWWRGGPRQHHFHNLFRPKGIVVEATSFEVAKLAGEAIAKTGATAVDAIVMASAAQRGDVVFTSDIEDLDLLRAVFPSVRLFGVN
jgi:predicted nucleic acid-binding protein